jgi:hypothetical protein
VLIDLATAELSVGYVKDSKHPKGWGGLADRRRHPPQIRVPVGSIVLAT